MVPQPAIIDRPPSAPPVSAPEPASAPAAALVAEPRVAATLPPIDPSAIAGDGPRGAEMRVGALGIAHPGGTGVSHSASQAMLPGDRRVARQLCAALDRAIALELFEHADRVALSGASLAAGYGPLAERLARLRLRQGQPETALAIVEGCASRSASLRLLRAVCLIQTGRKLEAHLDLHEWCRRAIAPLDARVMLALLEWESGDRDAALRALQHNLKHLEDPRSIQTLLLLAVESGHMDQARAWADRLADAALAGPTVPDGSLLLRSLHLRPRPPSDRTTARQVDLLAMELQTSEHVIATLVEAQRRQPEPRVILLLASAIELALPELGDRAGAMEAMARLAIIEGDVLKARTWADRALAMSPMSASLALLQGELDARAQRRTTEAAPRRESRGVAA